MLKKKDLESIFENFPSLKSRFEKIGRQRLEDMRKRELEN
jgi:hypothetical protein